MTMAALPSSPQTLALCTPPSIHCSIMLLTPTPFTEITPTAPFSKTSLQGASYPPSPAIFITSSEGGRAVGVILILDPRKGSTERLRNLPVSHSWGGVELG